MDFILNFIVDSKEKAEIIHRQTTLPEVLKQILEHLKRLPRAAIFLNKVGKKEAPGYYEIIKQPMDLGTMTRKIPIYKDLDEFKDDIDLIVNNCLIYNKNIEYYTDCANDLKAEADMLFMRFNRVYPKEPQKIVIEGIPAVESSIQLRKTVLKYFKLVGFESTDKKCLDIICDVMKYKICNYIKISQCKKDNNK